MYEFKIPIGDWSGDGHNKVEWYIIRSNKPVKEIRELYFKACDKLGFTLDGHNKLTPCSEYGDNHFDKTILKLLLDFGIKIDNVLKEYIELTETIDSDGFIEIVLALINTQDPDLKLEIVNHELFQFCGFDKNKYIGYFGYGLFD